MMPGDIRPVFYFVPVNNISANNMIGWLSMAFQDRVRPVLIPNSRTYGISKRFSKTPEKFGTGHIEGVVEAGAANNAAI